MASRALILLRARLQAQRDGARLPIASLFMQAFAATVACALPPSDLPHFAYALYALSVSAFLVAIPLFGELGDLLVRDEAEAWVSALPLRSRDLRLARLGHLCIALGLLTLGALVPAALLADGFSIGERLLLIAAGLAQSLFLAALLVSLMSLLSARAQALLVLLQTGLFLSAIVGGALGLRHLDALRTLNGPTESSLAWFPPAWFAAPFAGTLLTSAWVVLAPSILLASLAVLAFVPAPAVATTRGGALLLGRALAPVRALALKFWVRRNERGVFNLVFEALPKEREFVLRTYPLIGLPLAFLLVGTRGEDSEGKQALLSLLLFTPGVYLPVLLAHVPVSASHRARWILDGAPLTKAQIDNAALKAVAIRFLLPLYLALGALSWSLCGAGFTLRMTPITFLVTLAVVRQIYRGFGIENPLSVPPEEIAADQSWFNAMMMIALLLTLAAVFATKLLVSPLTCAIVIAALLFLEWIQDRQLSQSVAE
ncbi:MAG TPA: hypothetical protein VK843_20280 [Planctomycetota bacterium]|nr:hypothetical protein [Planctomycetota bacterium]